MFEFFVLCVFCFFLFSFFLLVLSISALLKYISKISKLFYYNYYNRIMSTFYHIICVYMYKRKHNVSISNYCINLFRSMLANIAYIYKLLVVYAVLNHMLEIVIARAKFLQIKFRFFKNSVVQ
jgi:hypothetical protein